MPVLPLQLAGVGVDASRLASATGLLIALYSVGAAGAAAAFGRWSDRYSLRPLLFGNLVLGAGFLMVMARAPSFPPLLLAAVGLGMTFAGAVTMAYAAGERIAPAEQRGRIFGLLSGVALVGGAIAPAVAGLVARVHLLGIYALDGALFVAAVVAASFLRLPRPKAPDVI
jgi:MFS family permease